MNFGKDQNAAPQQTEEIETIARRMRIVPQLHQLDPFLRLKKTGEATDVTVKYRTSDETEPMWAELIIKTTAAKKDRIMRQLEAWESEGLIEPAGDP